MKRRYLLYALVLALLLVGGCTQGQGSDIGAAQAKELALADAGLTAAEVDSLTADLTAQNGGDCYQVEFTAAGKHHQYVIDARTGTIVKVQSQTQNGGTAGQTETTAEGLLTPEEAKAKALAHANLTDSQVTFVKSQLDREKGRQVYEVEFYTADAKEYDYEIDAATGDVVSFDCDAEVYTASNGSGTITEDQAKTAALSRVPGATAQDIREFKKDRENGRTVYEGKIVYNSTEYEFEVDGQTGHIRSWEEEPAHH